MRELFKERKLRELNVRNGWFVPPMCTYVADELTNEFNYIHYDHYSSFAQGGFKTIIIESNAVNEKGRLSVNDIVLAPGYDFKLYNLCIDNIHRYGSLVGVQINHGGELGVNSDGFAKFYDNDKIMSVINDFKNAIKIANEDLNVDFLEIHGAHGYFLDQIVTNRNDIKWDIDVKAKIVHEILDYALSFSKPVGIRINAIDDALQVNDKNELLTTWKKLLSNYEHRLEYISITTSENSRVGKLYNLEALKMAKEVFSVTPLISCAGVETYEDGDMYFKNGSSLVGIGTNAFKDKNILYSFSKRHEVLDQNNFKTLVRISNKV